MIDFKSIGVPVAPGYQELHELRDLLAANTESLDKEFREFEKFAYQVINEAKKRLTEKVDTEPVALQDELVECSALSFTVGQASADAKVYQQLYELLHYYPKKPKYSEGDRKLYTQTKAVKQFYLVKQLTNAEERLDKRITIFQSILKAETSRWQKGDVE